MKTLIAFREVTKEYHTGDRKLLALNKASFEIAEGEFVVILGPSGAGKSTILNLLGGMDGASSGRIIVDGNDLTILQDNDLADYRANHVGFVFQFYNLIPTLTALENVSLIKELRKGTLNAAPVLESVGLKDHLHKFPSQLSGGEQQRVSIARAICKNPTLLLCDEPTGALDSETGIAILCLLQGLCKKENKTLIIVTHNSLLAPAADKVIKVKNGKIEDVIINPNPVAISEVSW